MVNKLPRSNLWSSKMLFFASEASDEDDAKGEKRRKEKRDRKSDQRFGLRVM
jgi:hypothetical protein